MIEEVKEASIEFKADMKVRIMLKMKEDYPVQHDNYRKGSKYINNIFWSAFGKMTERSQKVLYSRFGRNKPYKEIGEELGYSTSYMHNLVKSSLKELVSKLNRE